MLLPPALHTYSQLVIWTGKRWVKGKDGENTTNAIASPHQGPSHGACDRRKEYSHGQVPAHPKAAIKNADLPALDSSLGEQRGREEEVWLPPRWAETQLKKMPGHCADPLRALPLHLFPSRRDTKASLWHGGKLEKHSGNRHANKGSKRSALF